MGRRSAHGRVLWSSVSAAVKICLMLQHAAKVETDPVMSAVLALLADRGFAVKRCVPEELVLQPDRITIEYDLYLLQSHSRLALSLAGVLHDLGAWVLNPYPSCIAAADKVLAAQRLRRAGIAAPRSWLTADIGLLAPLLDKHPLILRTGSDCATDNAQVVRHHTELAALSMLPAPTIAQEYFSDRRASLTLYVAGERVSATRRLFGAGSTRQPEQIPTIDPCLRQLALSCGRVFGLGLYAIDIIERPGGPAVVGVDYFPSYAGQSEMVPAIADYIAEYANGAGYLHSGYDTAAAAAVEA